MAGAVFFLAEAFLLVVLFGAAFFVAVFFVVFVTGSALVVAANSSQAIVMLGGLAVAYGFQMYPSLIGICYYKGFNRKGVVAGLIAGLIAVTLTDKTSIWFGVPWGAYPFTIHSAGWGIFFNLIIFINHFIKSIH